MSQRRVDMFVFSSNRAFLDASFARKLDMIYMDGAVRMDADDSTFLLRVHSVLLLLEGANLRFGLHTVLNAGWILSIYNSRMFRMSIRNVTVRMQCVSY